MTPTLEKISESYNWTYRDSFYQFILTPSNYVPGFILGVVWGVIVIYFGGLSSNPLLGYIGNVISMLALYVIASLIWEYVRYRGLSDAQKTLRWTIDDETLKCLNGAGESRVLKWSRVNRVKRTLSGYMIHRSSGDPVWISLALFTPDQAEQFETFLDERER